MWIMEKKTDSTILGSLGGLGFGDLWGLGFRFFGVRGLNWKGLELLRSV